MVQWPHSHSHSDTVLALHDNRARLPLQPPARTRLACLLEGRPPGTPLTTERPQSEGFIGTLKFDPPKKLLRKHERLLLPASIRPGAAARTSKQHMRGRAQGNPGTCNRKPQMSQMPRGAVLLFPDSLPTFGYSPSRGKPTLPTVTQQNAHLRDWGLFRSKTKKFG